MFFKGKQHYYSSNLERYISGLNRGDLSMISKIFCVFSENSPRHKLKAARALKGVLECLSYDDICRIDVQMRQTTSMEWSIDWRALNIKGFLTSQMSQEEKRAVAIFSSFNPNGYIRQKAVELLCSYELTIQYIMLRQIDWVHEVRQSALNSFLKKFEVATEQELLISLPFLEKLHRSKRCDCSVAFDLFYKELCEHKNKRILAMGLNSKDVMTRKCCLRILFSSPESNHQILENQIYKEKDPFLRKQIFMSLLKTNVDLVEISEKFLKDKYPANRIIALQYLYEFNKEVALQKVKSMLLDKNANVRALARNILREANCSINFSEFYLENLSKNTSCAILGLGEVGSTEDCITIEKYLNGSTISVVRASMISLMRLNANKYGNIILEKLLSEHIGIVKTAKLLIEKYKTYDFKRIFDIYQITASENTKIKCAALLFLASKWQRLIYILIILSSEYESLQTLCHFEICKWIESFNRSYTVATEEQKEKIKELIELQKHRLGEKIKSQLLFLIK